MKHLNCHNKFLFTNPFAYQANLLVGSAKRNFPQAALYQTKIFRARMHKCRSATYYPEAVCINGHNLSSKTVKNANLQRQFFFPSCTLSCNNLYRKMYIHANLKQFLSQVAIIKPKCGK